VLAVCFIDVIEEELGEVWMLLKHLPVWSDRASSFTEDQELTAGTEMSRREREREKERDRERQRQRQRQRHKETHTYTHREEEYMVTRLHHRNKRPQECHRD